MILPASGPWRRDLASRVLGPSLRRLVSDMHSAQGCPVLLAENFVDPARFVGTRRQADQCAQRKRCSCMNPSPTPKPDWQGEPKGDPPPNALRSLFDFLSTVPEFR